MRDMNKWILASLLMASSGVSTQALAEVNIGFKYDYTKYTDSGTNYSSNLKLNQYYATLGASNEFSEAYVALGAANLKSDYRDDALSVSDSQSGLLYGVGTRLFTELESGLRPSIDVFYSVNDFDSVNVNVFDVTPEMGYVINLQNDVQLIPSAGLKYQHMKLELDHHSDLEESVNETSGVIAMTLQSRSVPLFARIGGSFGSDMNTFSFQLNYGF
ncbi:MAG: hypothetical protein ACRCR6_02645 [Plesiomonas sp.]